MKKKTQIEKLTDRSREIFRCLVETYLSTGEPVGSRTLAKNLNNNLQYHQQNRNEIYLLNQY